MNALSTGAGSGSSGHLASPGVAAADPRLVFLDAVRALAVVLMVFAHFTDQLLAPEHRATVFGALYGATRGFTAPLFFVVSGWSIALVMVPRIATGRLEVSRRLKRGALLLALGYALTLPWWAEGFPFDAPAAVWPPFWCFGVLQSLAVALWLATVLARAVPGPGWFLLGSGGLAVAAIAAAPWLRGWSQHWPAVFRGAFDPQGVGGAFPLAPWAGYVFSGVVLGGVLLLRSPRPAVRAGVLVLLGIGALALHLFLPPPFKLVGLRLGTVACILAAASLATGKLSSLPKPVRALSHGALTCYVLHMVLLWGVPGVAGLVHRINLTLGWWECLGLTVGCLGLAGPGWAVAKRIRVGWPGRGLATS